MSHHKAPQEGDRQIKKIWERTVYTLLSYVLGDVLKMLFTIHLVHISRSIYYSHFGIATHWEDFSFHIANLFWFPHIWLIGYQMS